MLGLVAAILRRRREELVLAVPVAATIMIVGQWQKQSPYYLLASYPALLVLGAVFIRDLTARLASSIRSPWGAIAAAAVIPIVFALPARRAVAFSGQELREDNRTRAEPWIQSHIPHGARVAVDWSYLPTLYDLAWIEEADSRRREQFEGNADLKIWTEFVERVRAHRVTPIEPSVEWLRRTDADYIITSSYCYSRFLTGRVPAPSHPFHEPYTQRRRFYEALLADAPGSPFRVMKRFDQGQGPVVVILRGRGADDARGDALPARPATTGGGSAASPTVKGLAD
jgi:hypothetical protein